MEYNDVVALGDILYGIKRFEKEGRFGRDEKPKYLVGRAIDLKDVAIKILKFVFYEELKPELAD